MVTLAANETESNPQGKAALSGLALTALGIVFGDIGTSPLYALKTVYGLAGGAPSAEAAIGLLSLIIWSLLLVVSFKYVTFVMRADNDGEGGILALMSLLRMRKKQRPLVAALGLFGAALIYGDGAITPAISVLSALEGLEIAAPQIAHVIVPLALIILVALFAVQHQGTARIGWIFGPVMTLWFLVLAFLGLRGIWQYPHVLSALLPWHAVSYLFSSGHH
jgi:KUP system potassium uptake protein